MSALILSALLPSLRPTVVASVEVLRLWNFSNGGPQHSTKMIEEDDGRALFLECSKHCSKKGVKSLLKQTWDIHEDAFASILPVFLTIEQRVFLCLSMTRTTDFSWKSKIHRAPCRGRGIGGGSSIISGAVLPPPRHAQRTTHVTIKQQSAPIDAKMMTSVLFKRSADTGKRL